jgi:tetratricopeptide (TPR) repeat protein
MDLMDFDQAGLYFDEPVAPEVGGLIEQAGAAYGEGAAEALLHKAYFLAPEALLVLVALYRYYFYQHRLDDALTVADRTLALVGRRLGFPEQWTRLHPEFLGQAVLRSMGLLRFYLSVLKATGYINLRLGRMEQGRAQIEKLIELDSHDRFGGKALLAVIVAAVADRLTDAA